MDLFTDDAYGRLQNQLTGGATTALSKLMLETIRNCLPTQHLSNFPVQSSRHFKLGEIEDEGNVISDSGGCGPVFEVQLMQAAPTALQNRPHGLETPRTNRLHVEPTTVAREHSSAYWQQFHE